MSPPRTTCASASIALSAMLCAALLAACSEGVVEHTPEHITRSDAGAADTNTNTDTEQEQDTTEPPDEDIAQLSIRLDTVELEVGQRVPVEVTGRTAAGDVVEPTSLQWHVGKDDVAAFEEPGVLTVKAAGQTDIWASTAEVDSNRIAIDVAEAGAGQTRYVRVEPSQVALAPGQTFGLSAEVRRAQGEHIEGLPVRWESSDEAVVTVDEHGTITAAGAGTAQVSALVENCEALPVEVLVTDEQTWKRARIVRPSAAIAARHEPIEVRVELRELGVGFPNDLGSPVQPDAVSVTLDGQTVGEASIDWETSSFTLDTADFSAGLHRLGATIELDGTTYETPPRLIWAAPAAPAFADHWSNLAETPTERWALDSAIDQTNGNPPGLAVDSQGTVYVAAEKPNRGEQAQIFVWRWDEDEGRWQMLRNYEGGSRHGLQLRHWSAQYEYFPSNTAQFVDLAVDDQDRPILTFTQEAVDDGGNGDEREKRWFDVVVARYEQGFGPGGTAGWRLLTSGAQDYLVNPPEAEQPQHPPPADIDENDDVFTPKVLWDSQRSRITAAWVSAPHPRDTTFLDVRTWSDTDQNWTTLGERLELQGSVPELREAVFDANGDLVAVIEDYATGGFELWRLSVDQGTWQRLDTTGQVASVAAMDAGQLAVVSANRGALRGATLADNGEASAAQLLNRSAWVGANQPVFIGRRWGNQPPSVLWYEGPVGSRQWLYGAWLDGSSWEPLDVELLTRAVGERRFAAAFDPQGRLVIARQVPTPEDGAPYSLLVVRSRDALLD